LKWRIADGKRRLGVLLLPALVLSGCGRPERSVVDEFFARSRLRDKTALQNIATVIFEPHTQGIVETFEITKVSPEERGTKIVTVSAQVKLPDGRMVQKTILLTLSGGLITGFLDVAASPGSPASPRS
jgi:hypothetical protein